VGPAAFPDDACSLNDGPPSPWRVGLTAGTLDTTLVFDGDTHVRLRQWSAVATASRRLGPSLSLEVGAGALLAGRLDDTTGRHDLAPGPVAMGGLTWLLLTPVGLRPFVAVSTTLSLAAARTEAGQAGPDAPYRAADLAMSGSVGWPIAGHLAPYAAAKLFGGPVGWRRGGASVTGTDLHHYQAAVGLAATLPGRLDLLLEWAPLGAHAVTAALGRAL